MKLKKYDEQNHHSGEIITLSIRLCMNRKKKILGGEATIFHLNIDVSNVL